jgi:hypothetical protein
VILLIVATLQFCKKKSVLELSENRFGSEALYPYTPPTMQSLSDVDAQLHKLAVGVCKIANDPAAVGIPISSFINPVKNVIWGSPDFEGTFFELDLAFLSNAGGPFFIPNPIFTHSFYDAMVYYIGQTQSQVLTSYNWDPMFFGGFYYNGIQYYNYLDDLFQHDIPATNNVMVVVNNQIVGQDIIGYTYDAALNVFLIKVFDGDEHLEDYVSDTADHYVFSVSYGRLPNPKGVHESSCEGEPPICGDGYCDEKCGEALPCVDCLPQYNKKLELIEVRINEDYKDNSRECYEKTHYERFISGKYEVNVSGIVVHSNNKYNQFERVKLRPKIKRKDVKRSKWNKSRGSSQWKSVNDKETGEPLLMTNNYNMYQSEIYLVFYEYDFLANSHEAELPSGVPVFQTLPYRSSQLPFSTKKIGSRTTYTSECENVEKQYVVIPANAPWQPTGVPGEYILEVLHGIGNYIDYNPPLWTPTPLINSLSFKLKISN